MCVLVFLLTRIIIDNNIRRQARRVPIEQREESRMSNATVKDYEEILRVAQLYVDGCARGDGEGMKPAFHASATINGAPIQTLFDGATQAGPTDSRARVDVLDVVNDVAVIRVTLENYFGADYVDFHVLKKDESGWKILAKVFTGV